MFPHWKKAKHFHIWFGIHHFWLISIATVCINISIEHIQNMIFLERESHIWVTYETETHSDDENVAGILWLRLRMENIIKSGIRRLSPFLPFVFSCLHPKSSITHRHSQTHHQIRCSRYFSVSLPRLNASPSKWVYRINTIFINRFLFLPSNELQISLFNWQKIHGLLCSWKIARNPYSNVH